MRQLLSRFLSDFSELTIFIPVSLGKYTKIGSGSDAVKFARETSARRQFVERSGRCCCKIVVAAAQLAHVVAAGEEGLDVARCLAQALAVLDEGDADETLTIFAKPDPRRDRDIGALEQEFRKSEAADRPKGGWDRCPGEHRRPGQRHLPTRLAQAVDQDVAAGAI